jgi:hypothetical protein
VLLLPVAGVAVGGGLIAGTGGIGGERRGEPLALGAGEVGPSACRDRRAREAPCP